MPMTPQERNLLLGTARILRAHLRDGVAGFSPGCCPEDVEALHEALAPFDGTGDAAVNEASD